jgi:hypothetical protein
MRDNFTKKYIARKDCDLGGPNLCTFDDLRVTMLIRRNTKQFKGLLGIENWIN